MKRETINPSSVFNSSQYGFSQAVAIEGGKRLVLSGQVGVDADERLAGKDLASQTNAAIDNIELILGEVDATLDHVIIMRLFIVETERDNQKVIAETLLDRFPSDPPATSWIIVSGLSDPEWLIEIEAEAVTPSA